MAERFFAYLPQLVEHMPASWHGTTFNNLHLLGRAGFAERLRSLLDSKRPGEQLTEADLSSLGEAEDYLRVASNVSTLLEIALAYKQNLAPELVFTFASSRMPVVAVCLAAGGLPVRLHLGSAEPLFSAQQVASLALLRCALSQVAGPVPSVVSEADSGVVVLALQSSGALPSQVDGLVGENVLYVCNPKKINPAEILVRRKRLATPLTTPAAEAQLRKLAGRPERPERPVTASIDEMLAHLRALAGSDSDLSPQCFTAGLPAIAALWSALIVGGGADVLMASTAYGGSSQLTDLLCDQTGLLRKSTFDIQGTAGVEDGIAAGLSHLTAKGDALLPSTVLFLENPTNPDMKVAKMDVVAAMLRRHSDATGRRVLLLVDTTFAPPSHVLRHLRKADEKLNAINFISLSKSVSRGHTVAGTLVFNHTEEGRQLHAAVASCAATLDITARPDQLRVLAENHTGVEKRCADAYHVAATVGAALVASVKQLTGHDMSLAFVTPATAALGFTSSTFSFNLPPIANASHADNEALAQRFVDALALHKTLFKPCVSFGQDNGLIYATVPATSTQGAIKAEDKAKQAQGGVQLTRLSFPPAVDVAAVVAVIEAALKDIYAVN